MGRKVTFGYNFENSIVLLLIEENETTKNKQERQMEQENIHKNCWEFPDVEDTYRYRRRYSLVFLDFI